MGLDSFREETVPTDSLNNLPRQPVSYPFAGLINRAQTERDSPPDRFMTRVNHDCQICSELASESPQRSQRPTFSFVSSEIHDSSPLHSVSAIQAMFLSPLLFVRGTTVSTQTQQHQGQSDIRQRISRFHLFNQALRDGGASRVLALDHFPSCSRGSEEATFGWLRAASESKRNSAFFKK